MCGHEKLDLACLNKTWQPDSFRGCRVLLKRVKSIQGFLATSHACASVHVVAIELRVFLCIAFALETYQSERAVRSVSVRTGSAERMGQVFQPVIHTHRCTSPHTDGYRPAQVLQHITYAHRVCRNSVLLSCLSVCIGPRKH